MLRACVCVWCAAAAAAVCRDHRGISNDADEGNKYRMCFWRPSNWDALRHARSLRLPLVLRRSPGQDGMGRDQTGPGALT